MKDQLITLETAKLAKEKGFKEPVLYGWEQYYKTYVSTIGGMYHTNHNKKEISIDQISNKNTRNSVSRPTQSLLQRWLIHNHNLISIPYYRNGCYHISVKNAYGRLFEPSRNDIGKFLWKAEGYTDYEEALEEGLQEALKLIK